MKKSILVSAVVLSMSMAATNVSAKGDPGSGPNPFSDCGIGAALFKDTKWAAVSSNIIWDVGTTAVVSATASPETCSGSQVVAAKFIIDNYDNIVEEIAEGSGEHVTSMYNVFNCEQSKHASMTNSIRSEMVKTITQNDYKDKNLVEKSSDLYNLLNQSAITESCSAS